jgi:hypothetical protein
MTGDALLRVLSTLANPHRIRRQGDEVLRVAPFALLLTPEAVRDAART